MIPNHARFLEAIRDGHKVSVEFYSTADNGVISRVCVPLEYGLGKNFHDGLNRYWLRDESATGDARTLGLVPQQIVELKVLGDGFDQATPAGNEATPAV